MSLYHSFIYPYLTYCRYRALLIQHTKLKCVLSKKKQSELLQEPNIVPQLTLFSDFGIIKFVGVNIYLTMLFMFRVHNNMVPDQGWGLLSEFSPFRYFPNFLAMLRQTLDIEYHVYIWQVSPQLSCGDTCQIWMWFEDSNMYFCHIENFAYGEINERSFSNPHPKSKWSLVITETCMPMIQDILINLIFQWLKQI